MKTYEIHYKINGEYYVTFEMPTESGELQFLQNVLNRIESLVMAGAVVTNLIAIPINR